MNEKHKFLHHKNFSTCKDFLQEAYKNGNFFQILDGGFTCHMLLFLWLKEVFNVAGYYTCSCIRTKTDSFWLRKYREERRKNDDEDE